MLEPVKNRGQLREIKENKTGLKLYLKKKAGFKFKLTINK